jgi:hypothetical protein
MSSLLLLNHESAQILLVGMLLLLLTSLTCGVPIMMAVVAQPTQGDLETNVGESASEVNSQSEDPDGSSQTDYEDPEDISRTNRSKIENVLPPEIIMIYEGRE